MKTRRHWAATLITATGLVTSSTALAHVGASGPAIAGENSLLTFSVGHGCEGADTYAVELQIPDGVLSVRAVPNPAFTVEIVLDDAELPDKVIFSKDPATVRPADDMYYQLGLRVAVPDQPFTTMFFPATQRCRSAEGEELVTEWFAESTEHGAEDAPPPAPAITILPTHTAGWNKFTPDQDIHSLDVFSDAQIVWVEDAAYSPNAETTALIEADEDVSTLEHIKAGSVVWVKY